MTSVKSKEIMDSFQRLSRVIKRRSAIAEHDSYSRSQGRVLRVVAANGGINARDLAAVLEIKPPSLTVKLNKLEADGCIIRSRDENDGRFVYVHITPKGYESIDKSDEKKKVSKRDFCDCLTEEEKEIFVDICDRLSRNLSQIIDEEIRLNNAERMARNKASLTNKDK